MGLSFEWNLKGLDSFSDESCTQGPGLHPSTALGSQAPREQHSSTELRVAQKHPQTKIQIHAGISDTLTSEGSFITKSSLQDGSLLSQRETVKDSWTVMLREAT